MNTSFAALNHSCRCVTLDADLLWRKLEKRLGTGINTGDIVELIKQQRPHLFSNTAVFMTANDVAQMTTLIRAIEATTQTAIYRDKVLAWAAPIAQRAPAAKGVFVSYDFHLSDSGPKLIEINTNAGGALLNIVLAGAQRACCEEAAKSNMTATNTLALEEALIAMFRAEWAAARGDASLRSIAIVDDEPEQQYLYPEFRLFQSMFQRHGFQCSVVDARALRFQNGQLVHDGAPIDLVYNRLTDFILAEPSHAALREAYTAGAAVVTPHPHAHALYADKRNLVLLTDPAFIANIPIAAALQQRLREDIPLTRKVTPEQADEFWQTRSQWFFKPASGYGSRAAYRGDKVTKRVFNEIIAGNYVAQQLVPPAERVIDYASATTMLKFDVRAYAYGDELQLLAARLYQGQTTNFRTAGGGFAPVFWR